MEKLIVLVIVSLLICFATGAFCEWHLRRLQRRREQLRRKVRQMQRGRHLP